MALKCWLGLKSKLKRGKKEGPKPELPDQSAPPTPAPSATTASAAPSPSPPPAPAASSQPVSSDTAPTLQSLPERLWNRAYDNLKKEESGLVDTYEKLLSRELEGDPSSTDLTSQKNEIEQRNPDMRRDQMSRLVTAGLKKIEGEAKFKEDIEGGIQPLSSAKGVIDTVVKAYPEASLAWAGVCCALQTRVNREGIAYVVSKMEWYWQLSRLLLDENRDDGKSAGLRDALKKHVIDLYKTLLSYQMKSVCSYYRSRHVVFWRDVIKLDDWAGTLEAVHSAEKTVREDSAAYNTESIKTHLDGLVKTAKSLEEKLLPGFRQALQQQTAAQMEMQQDKENKECLADLHTTDPRDDKKRIKQTKGGLLEDSSNWILKHEDFRRWRNNDEARLLWIKGDPGKGKTMLLIAIVDELERQLEQLKQPHQQSTTVLSYFFCQGTNSVLNNATAVLRGLIYLLGVQNPSLLSHLRKRYDTARSKLFEGANVFFSLSKVLEDMLREASLSRAYIVIDALDECEKELPHLLKFIAENSSASPCVKWIVSSRNRHDIEQQLKLDSSGMKLSLELTQNAEQVSHAVNAYIDFKISNLRFLEDDTKQRDRVRDIMRQKATGTFLWVALVVQELQGAKSWEILQVVEEVPTSLQELYDRMMNQIQQLNRKNPEFCLLVLSTVTLAYRPLRLAELGVLSGLPEEITNITKNVGEIVALCGSFLTIQDNYVYLIHQSVKDYLSGKASNIYNLRHPGLLIGEIKAPDPDPLAAIRYSCIHWIGHFCDAYNRSRPEAETVGQFLRKKFLYWLEALGLIQHMGNAILSMTRLESLLKEQSSYGELLDLIQDSRRFLLQNRWVIENAPLQAYASALIFSPVNCLMRKIFEKEAEWIQTKPVVASAWSSCLQTLESHNDSVLSVAFSHDSKLLASASDDNTIKIWDAVTGSLQQTLEGHKDSVLSVAFSHDSKLLASASYDKTIKIWDAETGSLQQTLEGHSSTVLSVAFSHDSKLLASASDEKTIKIWDAATGSLQQTLELGITVQTMSFEDTGLYLDTNIGRIDLAAGTKRIQSLPQTPHPVQTQEAQYCGYALSRDRSWITWNEQSVLWLPTDYRPSTYIISSFASPSTPSTVTRIGLGYSSGRVVVIGLLECT
ncbi:hypothetical protein DL764_009469 [Monosporascus ibericus]|uniref:NACHT domain-containing protein n=1 Tax=Monosporascus ibericus TaxID=155417 RepID=A0A4Q4SUW3_9PEZI|nr:hypothetical protein DL764_009469 [Monosporascus ibericus]